jgi:branched-chain amino acid transport system permease protein
MAMMKKYGKYLALILVAVVVIALPLLLNTSRKGKFQIQVLTVAMIWAIATLSLNLILGYTGQACLAHGAFFGIGAYTFAIFVERVGINFWPSLLIACLFTAFLGFLIGLPSLRTKGPYFAIVTLCFNVIVYNVFENWTWLSGGITGQRVTIPSYLGERWVRYYLVLAFLVLVLLIERQIVKSLLGASFIAIRSNENLTEAVGISSFRNKLLSFTVSCFLVGLAGALFATEKGSVDITVTNYLYSFYILIYLLIGGVATLSGPVVGAVGIFYLLERIQSLKEFRFLIFGLILVAVIIFLPMGIVGGVKQFWEWIRGRFIKTEEALE